MYVMILKNSINQGYIKFWSLQIGKKLCCVLRYDYINLKKKIKAWVVPIPRLWIFIGIRYFGCIDPCWVSCFVAMDTIQPALW